MKIAIVSVQTQKSSFDMPNPVSFCGITEFDLTNIPANSPPTKIFTQQTIGNAVDIIARCDVAACFADFTIDAMNQYSSSDLNATTRHFDIHFYLECELQTRVKLATLGHSFNLSRTVMDGRACVTFFKDKQYAKITECIRRDNEIMFRFLQHIWTEESLTLSHNNKDVVCDVSAFRSVIEDLAKPSIAEKKSIAQKLNDALEASNQIDYPWGDAILPVVRKKEVDDMECETIFTECGKDIYIKDISDIDINVITRISFDSKNRRTDANIYQVRVYNKWSCKYFVADEYTSKVEAEDRKKELDRLIEDYHINNGTYFVKNTLSPNLPNYQEVDNA